MQCRRFRLRGPCQLQITVPANHVVFCIKGDLRVEMYCVFQPMLDCLLMSIVVDNVWSTFSLQFQNFQHRTGYIRIYVRMVVGM